MTIASTATLTPTTLIILPDRLTDPIHIRRIGVEGETRALTASLTTIRTGETGRETGTVRRYEMAGAPNLPRVDLVNRRVVIEDVSEGRQLPEWAREASTLHPDRHDIAAWFGAAARSPEAPWIAHLPLVVRDALRAHGGSPGYVIAMSDRAAYAASTDRGTAVIASLQPSMEGPAHEIDAHCHRTGKELAPLRPTATGAEDRRRGIVTRSQGVIAEALVNAHDARPLPDATTMQARWTEIVAQSHASRLRRTGASRFAAPVAILDDHRDENGFATLLLATIHIVLDDHAPDIAVVHHEAIRIRATGPIQVDLRNLLAARGDEHDEDRAELLRAARDQDMPVLEISVRGDGTFASRRMFERIGDASLLLREEPPFTLSDAALAILHFREPAAHKPKSGFSWKMLLPHLARERSLPDAKTAPPHGSEKKDGAGADEKVADKDGLPDPDEDAPGTEKVGEDDIAHGTGDGSETVQDDDAIGATTEPDDPIDTEGTTDDGTGREDAGGGTDTGTGVAADMVPRTTKTPTKADIEDEIGSAFSAIATRDQVPAEAAAPPYGSEKKDGAGADEKVADKDGLPDPDEDAPGTEKVGEDDIAHGTGDGSETVQGDDAIGGQAGGTARVVPVAVSLSGLIAEMSETDRDHVAEARRVSATAKVVNMPSDDALMGQLDLVERRFAKMVEMTANRPLSMKRTTEVFREARAVFHEDERWAKMLIALAIVKKHVRGQTNLASFTTERENEAIRLARSWAVHAALPWPDGKGGVRVKKAVGVRARKPAPHPSPASGCDHG